jgi:PAS domain S-box-containing protein
LKYVNPITIKMLGYSEEVLTSMPFVELIHPEDREKLFEAHIRIMNGEENQPVQQFRVLTSDGTVRWADSRAVTISWEGKPATLNFITDVTTRKRAEKVIQEEKTLSESIINSLPGIFYLFDAQGKFLRWNRNFEIVSGYSHQEMLERHPSDFFAGKEKELVQQRIRDTFVNGEANVEARFTSRNGAGAPYFLTGVRIEINGQPHLMGMGVDITERKQAEDALRGSEERYRTILESIEDGYFEVDIAGNFTFFNDSVCRMIGYTRAELMGMNDRQYTDKENRQILHQAFNKVFRTGESSKGVAHEIIGKEGTKLYIESSASLIRNTSGQPIGFRGIMRNITERKRAEEAIIVAKNDWENTFDSVTDIITIHDEDFNIIRANPAAKAIFGLQLPEGMPLAKCFRCYHGTENPPAGCASCQCFQTGKPCTVEVFEPYLNRHLEIRAIPRFGSDGRPVGLIHVVRDITERKKAEKQLQDTLESLRKAVGTTIQVISSTVEARDPYTSGHQIRSADLARAIAMEMGLPQEKIDAIRMAGSIHDIGKISIPAEILSKPTKLSEIEFSLIKEHAQRGFEMLKDVESPWPLAEIVLQHHERMDGSGYPRNLKGEEILIEVRILSVADVVEAMASHRPYRPGLGIDAALAEIENNRGIFYDDAVADACLRLFREKGFKLEGHDFKR